MSPETLDALDKDELKPLLLKLFAQNGQLLERIDDLLVTNKELLARIAELEARQGPPPKTPPKTPANSSLPPSSGQKANAAPDTNKKRRKGRPGVARELCANPDQTRDILAERCACGAAVSLDDQTLVHAYDHIDLPPIKPVTTRINLHRAQCPCCRKCVTAEPPADMTPGSPFGPGIVSIAAYLHGCHMVSYNRLVEVFDGLLGLKLSEGAIANMLARTGKPFAAEAEKIADVVRASPVISSDETRRARASSARPGGSGCSRPPRRSITRSCRRAARPCRSSFSAASSLTCGSRIGCPPNAGTPRRTSSASPI